MLKLTEFVLYYQLLGLFNVNNFRGLVLPFEIMMKNEKVFLKE